MESAVESLIAGGTYPPQKEIFTKDVSVFPKKQLADNLPTNFPLLSAISLFGRTVSCVTGAIVALFAGSSRSTSWIWWLGVR
jgi:hypothetical protein